MSISNPKRPRGPTKPPLRTIEDNVADEALQDVLDGVEKGLSRLPVDDRYRPPLLQVREGLMLRLGQDPLSEAPAPLAQVLALSPSLRGGESR